MGYDNNPFREEQMISGRKLAILFGIFAFAAFIILAVFVFPIQNLIRAEITQEASVTIKQDDTCVIETSDHPRTISDCQYNVGDVLVVTYKDGMLPIESHRLK